ncbi:Tetratricopeptide TPR_1 repeat-containing protein [uncultured Paludibacter sp.]|nr:Tetratricopeptide TPR_1 repeat-containing protein [uncultured Paludibacter sp.]
MYLKNVLFTMICLMPSLTFAQKEANDVISGNRLYKKEKFTEAEIEYRKAIVKNNKSFEANYNLGNALYKQGKFDEAMKQYQAALPFVGSDKKKAAAEFHNMGNSLLSQKKIEESIKAFQLALKNNPSDNETRYNLAYAMALLKKQQQNNQNNKDNKNNQDKNKDQQQNKDQNQDKQQDKENKKPQPQPQEPQMSKENAQQILDALQQDEKDAKEKADKARARGVKRAEKDW